MLADIPNFDSHDEKQRLLASVIPEIACPDSCSICCEYHLFMNLQELGGRGLSQYLIGEHFYGECPDGRCHQHEYGKCKIFFTRPLICRIFWKIEGDPPCHGGLEPDSYLSHEEFRRLLWCWQWGTIQDAKAFVAITRH